MTTLQLSPTRSHAHRRLHSGSLSGMGQSAFSRVTSSLASGVVRGVTIRSNLSPDITMSPQEAAGPTGSIPGPGGSASGGVPAGAGMRRRGGFSEALLAVAKPEIELDTIAGRVRLAPWGRPTTNLFWPVVILGGASVAALGILIAKRVAR